MKRLLDFIKAHWISIPLCLVILYLCFMDTEPLPKVSIINFDKFVHCCMFLTVSGIIFFENSKYFKKSVSIGNLVKYSFFFPTIYSGLIEIGQEYLTSTRSGDWLDFLFDGIGAFLGLIICIMINKR